MTKVAKIEDPQVVQVADPMVSMIERVASDPNADLDKLERMLAMKERIDAEAARSAFAADFASASAEFPSIPLNGVGHNNKRYALLKDIVSKTRPVLSRYGLVLNFAANTLNGSVEVTAKLSHKMGHTESVTINLPADKSGSKNDVQAVGSSLTYGQRYAAQSILGLSLGDDIDDDGAAHSDTVTIDQFRELRGLIEKSGADEAKFKLAFGAKDPEETRLEEFPAAKFEQAKAMLLAKIEKGAGQ